MDSSKQKPKNPHEGHRERMREEFLSGDINENTPHHRILELLLFYCVPRVDTNELAHELLDKYGTMPGVLDAPIDELCKFRYMSRNGATLLKLIMPIARVYTASKQSSALDFCSLEDIGNFFASRFAGVTHECVAALFLNSAYGYIDFNFISEGSMDSVGISIKDLLKRTLEKNAAAIAIVHNHPSGIALPSASDRFITETISETLRHVGITFVDHVIISGSDYVSMAQSSEYTHLFTKVY